MLKLVQTFGAHAGRTREFDLDVVRIGRLPTCEFAFDAHADLDASGLHAEIRREQGQYVVVDAGSRNGTLVGGRPIQRHVLSDGEEIEFGTGGPRIRVTITGGAPAAGGRGYPTSPATPIDLGGPPEPSPRPASVRPMSFAPGQPSPIAISPPTAPPPSGAPPAPDANEIARIVEERTRPLVYAVGIMGLLLIVTMCGLTGIGLYLVTHASH